MNTEQITNLVTKGFASVFAFLAVAVLAHHCKIDAETIQECKKACKSMSSQMESVTSRECACYNIRYNSADDWLTIPRP